MKINYKKMPFLGMIESGDFGRYPFYNYKEDSAYPHVWMPLLLAVKDVFPSIHKEIAKNVVLVSKSYQEAMFRSTQAFCSLFDKDSEVVMDSVRNCCGCYILQDYHSDANVAIIYYSDDKTMLFLGIADNDTLAYAKANINGVYYEGVTKHEIISGEGDNEVVKYFAHYFIFLRLMEKYAKVETRVVPAGARMRLDPRYLEQTKNESRLNIKYRDSRWFTSIIRNEGFSVRGHFRLQPKKVGGEWTRELIYINEFQKHGYHRQAQITTLS